MANNIPPAPPIQSGIGRLITLWTVVLLGALLGMAYLHYQSDWSRVAGLVPGVGRVQVLWGLGGVALLALLALFWVINRQTRRRTDFHTHRAWHAIGTVSRLLQAIQVAYGESSGAGDGSSHAKQADEISRAGREIAAMADVIGRINHSVSTAAGRAGDSAGAAKQGAAAVQKAVAGINDTHSRIQGAAERLRQLSRHARRFNETTNLIRDVTEQTSVLALNAAIRGDSTVEPGTAEEMQRLADRAARGAGEIAELTRAIQSDAERVIASLETLAGEVVAGGTALADETAPVFTEIESAGREFREQMDRAAREAAGEFTRAQAMDEKMGILRTTAEQSGEHTSRVVAAIEKLKKAAAELAQSSRGYEPPESRRS